MQEIEKIKHFIEIFNWQAPSWDLFILLGWLIVSVVYVFAAGRGKTLSILVSIYISRLLLVEIPQIGELAVKQLNKTSYASFSSVIVFGVLFLFLFLVLSHYVFKTVAESKSLKTVIVSLGFAIFQVGLLINSVMLLLPKNITIGMAPLIHYLFLTPGSKIFWLIAPITYLFILGRALSTHDEA